MQVQSYSLGTIGLPDCFSAFLSQNFLRWMPFPFCVVVAKKTRLCSDELFQCAQGLIRLPSPLVFRFLLHPLWYSERQQYVAQYFDTNEKPKHGPQTWRVKGFW